MVQKISGLRVIAKMAREELFRMPGRLLNFCEGMQNAPLADLLPVDRRTGLTPHAIASDMPQLYYREAPAIGSATFSRFGEGSISGSEIQMAKSFSNIRSYPGRSA
ncbi:MAG TPA: hypothetical protein VHD32_00625 [Candidatus Didemnitutus sp.]|nr:hypothetical protein [Candidatus Didemnitutus sp.]